MGLSTQRRKRWKRRGAIALASVVGVFGFLATVQPATDLLRDVVDEIESFVDPAPPPPRAQRLVRRFVKEMKSAVPWSQGPAVFPASVDLFERRFRAFDTERVHDFSLPPSAPIVDVWNLAQRAPQLQGNVIIVRARGERVMQVTTNGPVTSWLYRLYDRKDDRVFAFSRVPAGTLDEPTSEAGDIMYARAILLADGGVNQGRHRVLYLVCSAIGRSTLMTFRFERGKPPALSIGKPRR